MIASVREYCTVLQEPFPSCDSGDIVSAPTIASVRNTKLVTNYVTKQKYMHYHYFETSGQHIKR
jgi:hypothetical protein